MSESIQTWNFVVSGMSCSGCMRKIRDMVDAKFRVSSLKIDLSQQLVTVTAAPDFNRDSFIDSVSGLGFNVRLAESIDESMGVNRLHQRKLLARLGVAGACAGNIMLVSIALYAGADASGVAEVLRWTILGMFVPVILYSAQPFYQASWAAIKAKKASVDFPIALALIAGTALGAYNLAMGSDQFYFDSLSVLVFLILASRYLVMRIQDVYLKPISTSDIFGATQVTKQEKDGSLKKVERESLKVGDHIYLHSGDYMPVDGELLSQNCEIDNSFLTGESHPVLLNNLDSLFAGARVLSQNAKVRVSKTSGDCRIHDLIEQLNQSLQAKTGLTSMTDRAAQMFTYLVLATCAVFLLLTYNIPHIDSLNRILALLVISCPCVLAIATPLAISLAVKKGLFLGLLIKRPDVFERAVKICSFVFDKTGTLTSGDYKVERIVGQEPSELEKNIVCSMEKNSWHPFAKSLRRFFQGQESLDIANLQETPGVGISGRYDGVTYEIKKTGEGQSAGFFKDGELLWKAVFTSGIRQSTISCIESIKKRMRSVYILSGDTLAAAMNFAGRVGFQPQNVVADASPELKAEFIRDQQQVAFLGDGINDCLAMANSDLAISMGGSPEATFRSSDVHLVGADLSAIDKVFSLSEQVMRIIRINMIASFFYNSVFGVAALMGLINPLWAAVLMPISSVSVVAHTLWKLRTGTK